MLNEREYPCEKFCSSGLISALFGGGGSKESSPPPKPKDTVGTKAQAEAEKKRQAGGMATQTSTSGFRDMLASYQSGLKPTLGS